MSTVNRASALKAKTVEITFKDVDVADNSADILTLFESNSGVQYETSNEWIIDVFPNFTVIITYLMLICRRFALTDDYRIHPKVSTPTVTMYYLSVIYGFFLASDCYLRPTPSVHARLWKESSFRHDFLEFLLTLPVPETLIPILAQFFPTETERSKNVFFVPSAAGFDLSLFFGRYIPVNFFSVLHDSAATLQGNASRVDIMKHVLSQTLFSATENNLFIHYNMADFLGYTINSTTATTAEYMNSKFHQVFTTVFNPVLFRDFQRRSSLAEIGLASPKFKTFNPNAYDILFSATAPNLAELKIVLQTVSGFLNGHIPCKQSLGQVLTSISGNSILNHGYSTYSLPVMSYNKNHDAATFAAITKLQLTTAESRAQTISFLDAPATPVAPTSIVHAAQYEDTTTGLRANVPAGYQISHYWPFSLLTPAAGNSRFPDATRESNDLVIFDPEQNITPKVLLLDIANTGKATSAVPLLCGKIIESFELDGSTIEMPDLRKPLGLQNSLFADSAIPFKYATRATRFYPRTQGSILAPLRRARPNATNRLPASSLLHDRTVISIPKVPAHPIAPRFNTTRVRDSAIPTGIPGMTPVANADWIYYIQSFIGIRTSRPTESETASFTVPNMDAGRLLIWSPYTYNTYTDSDDITPDYAASHHFFIMNLRTLFGTDYNLVEMKHPFEALPVS